MTPPDDGNGWNEWQRHVLAALQRMTEGLASLQRRFDEARLETAREIAMLKIKSGAWGATAAGVVILITYVISLLKGS